MIVTTSSETQATEDDIKALFKDVRAASHLLLELR